jgi:hypothetical protein
LKEKLAERNSSIETIEKEVQKVHNQFQEKQERLLQAHKFEIEEIKSIFEVFLQPINARWTVIKI